jgi:hypothetical protein
MLRREQGWALNQPKSDVWQEERNSIDVPMYATFPLADFG